MLRGLTAAAVMGLSMLAVPVAAKADVAVQISTSSQTMDVFVDGMHYYSWPVSTGRRGYSTPHGRYGAKRMERMWYSSKYDSAPMPYSIFFRGGYAIHATQHTQYLGRPASHGCVRLAPSHARQLYSLVSSHGMRRTRISVH
ncbi:MAG: L,D-transpeptidase [Hyphomicrobium sp.]